MTSSRVYGESATGTGDTAMYTGRGRLLGVLISHIEATAMTVTIQDGTTSILVIKLHPEQALSLSGSATTSWMA